MLETGEADMGSVKPDQAIDLKGKGFDIVSIPREWYLNVALLGQYLPSLETYDPDVPWLDKRVREAMNLAIDREAIAEHLFSGYATPSGTARYTEYGESLEPRPYDPDRAKQLLAEAGYPDGFDFEMWSLASGLMPDISDVLQAVAGYWQAIGINAEISPLNVMAVYGDIVQRKVSGVAIGNSQETMLKPNAKAFSVWGYSKSSIFPLYESESFDVMVEGYLAANTIEERDSFTEQMVQYLYDEYAFVPLVAADDLWAQGDIVGNWTPVVASYLDLEYVTHAEPLGTFRLFEP
jgi:peptide/nickel transport system substrate-binding protein